MHYYVYTYNIIIIVLQLIWKGSENCELDGHGLEPSNVELIPSPPTPPPPPPPPPHAP